MKKYAVIGNPVEHSLSPKLHNYWIKKHKINAFYEKYLLKENDLRDFNNFCEECKKEDESVSQNLILTGFKICKICRTSKTIFPI